MSKLNVTLLPTTGITSGYIMAVIFTRNTDALDNPSHQNPFNINSIPPSTIIFSQAVAAPILASTSLTTPTLPVANFYGLLVGRSVLGNLTDMVPMTADILNSVSGITADSDQIGSNAPYTMTYP
jgi:hypothetical protein